VSEKSKNYPREPDAITVAWRVTTRIRLFIVAVLMMRLWVLRIQRWMVRC